MRSKMIEIWNEIARRVRARLVQEERERIIKLLSNPLHHNIQSPDIHKDCYTCVLVELIKGEQK